jgi:hypothetical protein
MSTTLLEKSKTRKRSAKSLKREIQDRLWVTDDPETLWAILKFIRKVTPEWSKMPKELAKQLREAKRDVAEGRYLSNEECMKWVEHRKQKH